MTRARANRLLTDALNPRRTVQERGWAASMLHKGSLKTGDRVAIATWKKFTAVKTNETKQSSAVKQGVTT